MASRFLNLFKGDPVIWAVLFLLCLISVIEVFSASSVLSYGSHNFYMPVMKHLGSILIGVFFTIFLLNTPCRFFKSAIPFLLFFSLLTLFLTLIGGEEINGAHRGLPILGIPFQPSELAKGSVVIAEALILSEMQTPSGADRKAMKYILIMSLPIIFFIFPENLSTGVLLFVVVLVLMFIGCVSIKQLCKLFGVILGVAVFFFLLIMVVGSKSTIENNYSLVEQRAKQENYESQREEQNKNGFADKILHRAGTWRNRLMCFFDGEEVPASEFNLDRDAQLAHANIAIASSGIVGVGPGNSIERDFLAQAFSDFIFAIIIEELGLIGAGVIVFLYIILLFRTARIAGCCANTFPAFLAMGLALLLVVQAIFNMLVAVGLVPITGQPLPLLSKGGTSIVMSCAYIGMILSVGRSAKKASPEIR